MEGVPTWVLAPARCKDGLVCAEDDAGQLDTLRPRAHLRGRQHLLEVLAVAPLGLAQAPVATGQGFVSVNPNLHLFVQTIGRAHFREEQCSTSTAASSAGPGPAPCGCRERLSKS